MKFRTLLVICACALGLWTAACGPSASAAARRAQALVAKGEFQKAERLADQELAKNPKDAGLWHVKIKSALAQGDNERATALYGKWVEIHGHDDHLALRMMAKTVLWQGLRVPSADIQTRAIQAIERVEIEALAEDVGNLIASDDDLVAAAAAAALLTSHPQAPEVATDLMRSEIPRARAIVIAAIGKKVGEHARDDLVAALDDPAPQVRRAALAAVARFENDEDTPRITKIATTDDDGQMRASALRELAARSFGPAPDLVRAALRDEYPGARMAALELVRKRRDAESIAILHEAAAGSDLPVAFRAIAALYKTSQPAPIDPIQAGLKADAWPVRAAALNAIADASPKTTALRIAGGAITDDHVQVRLTAARLLQRLGQVERARKEYAATLGSDDPGARLGAAIDLVRLDDPRGLAAIEQLARGKDPDTRSGALRAHQQAKEITGALVDALADEHGQNRLIAAEVLLDLAI